MSKGEGRRDIELVDHGTWIDSHYILMALSEDIQVALPKEHELPPNRRVYLGANACYSIQVIVV